MHFAWHSHIRKRDHPSQLHSHMLDLPCQGDHLLSFKSLVFYQMLTIIKDFVRQVIHSLFFEAKLLAARFWKDHFPNQKQPLKHE